MLTLDISWFAHGVRATVFVLASLGLGTAGSAVVSHLQAEAAAVDTVTSLAANHNLPHDVAALLVTSDRR